MRITGGSARGTSLRAPKTPAVRPMTDRVKESLFSHLGERVRGAAVLDLFAGSGSLGIEALSRGAESAVFVESRPDAAEALRENLMRARLEDRATVIRQDVRRFLTRPRRDGGPRFDVAFVDPPYAWSDPAVEGVLVSLVPLLRPGAAVCLHREKAGTDERAPRGGQLSRELGRGGGGCSGRGSGGLPWPEGYRAVFERAYGGALVGVAELSEDGAGA